MAIPFFVIAAVLFAAAYQNQLGYLATNASEDIKGFLPWAAAMAVIGAIGMFAPGRKVSNALFFLVILVLFIKNRGILDNITSKRAFTPVSPPAAPAAPGAKATQPPAAAGTQATSTPSSFATDMFGNRIGPMNPATASIPPKGGANVIPFSPLSVPGLPADATGVSMSTSGNISFTP